MRHREGHGLDLDVHAVCGLHEVTGVVGSVGHDPDPVFEAEDRPVVDHEPFGVAEGSVSDLPDGESAYVVGVQPLRRGECVRTPELPFVER